MSKLVIFGAGEFAHIAFEYFSHDSGYEVAGFVVDDSFHKSDTFQGMPLIPLSKMASEFPNSDFEVFVALTATNLNKDRTRLFRHFKSEGYKLATYVSSHAFVWRNVVVGENTFILKITYYSPSSPLAIIVFCGAEIILAIELLLKITYLSLAMLY